MYSCLNFITLQRILERVTGERLYEYAQRHVFDVLGLRHTCYFPLIYDPAVGDSAGLARLCAPTEVQADGKPLIAQVHDPMARRIMGGNSGNAGVFSNAEDLSVVCAAVMNGGVLVDKKGRTLKSTRILSPLTVRLMATIPPQNDPSVGRALGWDKKSSHSGPRGDLFNPETTIMHTGYTGTSIVIDTEPLSPTSSPDRSGRLKDFQTNQISFLVLSQSLNPLRRQPCGNPDLFNRNA